MMVRIFKFEAGSEGTTIVGGQRVLTVQMQDGEPMIWAEVDPESPSLIDVMPVPTGAEVPPSAEEWRYVSTIVGLSGRLVFHFYVRGELSATPHPD